MSSENRKLTPAELLAELAASRASRPSVAAPPVPAPAREEELKGAAPGTIRDSDLNDSADDDSEESGEEYINTGRGAVRKKSVATLDLLEGHEHLSDLFNRVNDLLGDLDGDDSEPFRPRVPDTLEQARLTEEDVERLVMKFLLLRGSATGRELSSHIKIPFSILDPLLKFWKQEQLLSYKSSAEMGDYLYLITEQGRDRARRYMEECSYAGAAPVALTDYLKAMESQTIAGIGATKEDLQRAFSDLLICEDMFERLGPAINSGRGMFLFGEAGNGKTSIAERLTACFGSSVWIPRTLTIDGDLIRLFDPGVHEELPIDAGDGLFDRSGIDQRWVRIVRPTIVAGGELTMDELEVTQNPQSKICEAPLQLKSNCGTLVIDDFGRQTMPVEVLLNRWIVPLEKRYDYLNLPSGKKIQVPFDQLIIFSTNLEPRDLVDGAFLRRIPYKIMVPDPSEEHFRKLFEIMAPKMGIVCDPAAVDHLINTHYLPKGRPFRNCQPRDLLLQIRNYCLYKAQPKRMTNEAFDFAVENYFSVM
ncbi:MAG: AAA family ATPase [Planctomycetaceae bacterium]